MLRILFKFPVEFTERGGGSDEETMYLDKIEETLRFNDQVICPSLKQQHRFDTNRPTRNEGRRVDKRQLSAALWT